MKIQRATIILLLAISCFGVSVNAQSFKLKNFSIGYRIFEVNSVGNSPFTIAPLLKDPKTYERFFNSIKYNEIQGNPGVMSLNTYYINAEWFRNSPLSSFWKKFTLQAGLLLTSPLSERAGSVADVSYYRSTDTAKHIHMYSLSKNLQFFGANGGVNKRFRISRRLEFLTGLHMQASFALVQHYKQQWDSSTYTPTNGWRNKTTTLPQLKGKKFFQWQAMVPLALEYNVYKNRFFIRFELDAGIIGSRYRPKYFSAREAHGAGIWFIYQQ